MKSPNLLPRVQITAHHEGHLYSDRSVLPMKIQANVTEDYCCQHVWGKITLLSVLLQIPAPKNHASTVILLQKSQQQQYKNLVTPTIHDPELNKLSLVRHCVGLA